MKILSAAQLRILDSRSGDTLALMETAGARVIEAIEQRFENLPDLKVVILCGKGNNGGDGFVIARMLMDRGCVARVALLARPEEITGDAAVNLRNLRPSIIQTDAEWNAFTRNNSADLVVDALLGTGLARPVEGLHRHVIESLRDRFPEATVLSVDIPSGLAADSAEVPGPAIRADITVTFSALKHCLVFPPAHKWAGEIVVADIGNPPQLLESPEHNLNLITPDLFPKALHRREEDTHKGDYGKVLIIAGSLGKSGAAAMTGQAALRAGAGLVTVATPAECLPIVAASMPELMTERLKWPVDDAMFDGKTVMAIGPGLGVDPYTQSSVRQTVSDTLFPIVLDADGLNAFAGYTEELEAERSEIVITPHPGEMARLIGRDIEYVNSHRIQVATSFAVKHSLYVVLKGFRTIVATPDGVAYINATGNPGMATAGMGDILSGLMAGIIAQNSLGTFTERVLLAVHLHGLAGDLAAEEVGEEPLVATDLLYYLGAAWEQIRA
jgi:ADP-dependent NAD(P)H-hydrate dehydratase / NAD(P)H-hydrate epimerase